jgi:hypothetical protein
MDKFHHKCATEHLTTTTVCNELERGIQQLLHYRTDTCALLNRFAVAAGCVSTTPTTAVVVPEAAAQDELQTRRAFAQRMLDEQEVAAMLTEKRTAQSVTRIRNTSAHLIDLSQQTVSDFHAYVELLTAQASDLRRHAMESLERYADEDQRRQDTVSSNASVIERLEHSTKMATALKVVLLPQQQQQQQQESSSSSSSPPTPLGGTGLDMALPSPLALSLRELDTTAMRASSAVAATATTPTLMRGGGGSRRRVRPKSEEVFMPAHRAIHQIRGGRNNGVNSAGLGAQAANNINYNYARQRNSTGRHMSENRVGGRDYRGGGGGGASGGGVRRELMVATPPLRDDEADEDDLFVGKNNAYASGARRKARVPAVDYAAANRHPHEPSRSWR